MAGLALPKSNWMLGVTPSAQYRFSTSHCEVTMTVRFLAGSPAAGFHFRDEIENSRFCLSATGEAGTECLEHFRGAMAIAQYHFQPHKQSILPGTLRERVLPIDQDSPLKAGPPTEGRVSLEQCCVSDIQAFGRNLDEPPLQGERETQLSAWRLLRQDLYLNDDANAFLTLHWKHSIGSIRLLDVIPGEGTKWLSGESRNFAP
jgi:hypothetical protein